MQTLKEKILQESISITKYRDFAIEIDKYKERRRKVALLSNFTIKGLSDCLKTKSYANDILIDVYEGQYSQWQQEILGIDLYNFNPELIIIVVDFFGMNSEGYFEYGVTNFDLSSYVADRLQELDKYLRILKSKTNSKIIISNGVKSPPIMGILESKIVMSYSSEINKYNQLLSAGFVDDSQVFVFDMDNWISNIGKKNSWNTKYFYLADMKIAPQYLPDLAEEMMYFIVPLFGSKKKCIVLDLDNTLWGGIIGEDGLEGIRLGPNGDGQPYYYFQKLLLNYKRRGFLLAVCSRNNFDDVKEVFNSHPYMILKENDFVSLRINWEDKASNIQAIAKEINIGLESLVFIDDDKANTALVKETLKVVDVIELGRDPYQYVNQVLSYNGLSTLEYTDEDKRRTDMYLNDRERKKSEVESVDLDSFLKELNIILKINRVDDMSVRRSAQLTQKTNQFNLTSVRYTEENIIKLLLDQNYKLWTLEVVDRFGDYGIVGLCIVHDSGDLWEIDTFLLSCRVLGKKIEIDFLRYILKELDLMESKSIRGKYIKTSKNAQVKDFFKLFDFNKVASENNLDIWDLETVDHTIQNSFKILTDKKYERKTI